MLQFAFLTVIQGNIQSLQDVLYKIQDASNKENTEDRYTGTLAAF